MKITWIVPAACTALFLLGMLLVSYGCWLAWKPGGYMFLGLVLAAGSFLVAYDQLKIGSRR